MCWVYNPKSKYAKKFGVFKKPYKPAYKSDLYGYIQSDFLSHLKHVQNQPSKYSIFYKPNLSTLLTIIWLNQQPHYRTMYYTWCCFLTKFTTIYYKPYIEYLMHYQAESKMANFNQNAALFKSLESYYYTTPHFETFKSDYFFYEGFDYPYLLPYDEYVFKNEFTVYGVLWTGVERLRQKKYNEYVRAHYILHQSKYTPIRARYTVKNFLYPKNKVLNISYNYRNWQLNLWYKFFLASKKRRYQLVLHTLQSTAGPSQAPAVYTLNNKILFSYYLKTKNYINTYTWNLLGDYQKVNSRWFRGLIYVPIVWTINKAFVDYIYQFPSQSRLDIIYSSDYIIAHGLSADVYDRLIEKQMIGIKHQTISEFMIENTIQDYFITHNLIKCRPKNKFYKKFINRLYDYNFDSSTINLLITNDVFNRYLLTRLFSNQVRVSPLKIGTQAHFMENTKIFNHIKDYILCGTYYKLPGYMARVMGVMSYFYWRSYNTDSIHQAYKGRLHLHHYMVKLNIQTLLSQQLYNVYKLILYMSDKYQIGASAKGLNEVWAYMSINYINWLHLYSYITFFCLSKNGKNLHTANYFEQFSGNKPYTSLLSHIAIRRYLSNYLTVFKRFRRAPYDQARGTCIHGKDPARLQQWLVHVNWMRIIGLAKDQLPFYLYPDQSISNQGNTDYLQELIKQTAHHHIDIYTCDLFIIENVSNSTLNTSFKPYIKITNLLYECSNISE